ncbi:hypothetical protein AVEN_136283-1 [Araneus ventricosus]|uniref:Uncharacterized protein n=1 Tax=Araneus ventricosus TaxID=182803 RepID=A0A4Y2W6D4_ARAVE|nr:hypothetical protein AVEN_136283-1 [Araneus ventricosus]
MEIADTQQLAHGAAKYSTDTPQDDVFLGSHFSSSLFHVLISSEQLSTADLRLRNVDLLIKNSSLYIKVFSLLKTFSNNLGPALEEFRVDFLPYLSS